MFRFFVDFCPTGFVWVEMLRFFVCFCPFLQEMNGYAPFFRPFLGQKEGY